MAFFDQEYYTGTDQYSDGDIENTILSIVEQGVNWKAMQSIPYPVLYHLSEERENILSWYPFRKNCRILEVGSGCGAITGLLCRKAKEVVSVELSKRRGWINYNRNKAYENLTIRIGNLNDMKFEEDFDYVVLNGVFEYAASFTEGEHPYETFLNRIKSYCKPDGHILIAIENRLGLKYFSGASEDHTNVHFLGLNEYEGNHTVRTFSKTEMEGLAARCGLQHSDFYYPYPDYKFPTEIYTDDTVNGSSYGRPYANLSSDRCFVFDECKMAHSLCREKVMGSFVNSFLVDLYQSEQPQEHVLYAKMCSGRSEKFRIQTRICQNNAGEMYVEKSPLGSEAAAHVERVKKAEQILAGKGYTVLNSAWNEDSLRYPYVNGKTVQAILKEQLRRKDQKGLCSEIERAFAACVPQAAPCNGYQTEAFCEMFGSFPGKKEEDCIVPANLDLIFDNVFLTEDEYMVIDPEWWVDFAVPRKFVLWRALNEFYSSVPEAEPVWHRKDCMEHFEISETQQQCYRNWAVHFAENYVGQSVTQQCAKPVHSGHLDKWFQQMRICSSLYLDKGNGFSEEGKIAVEAYCDDGSFELRFDLGEQAPVQAVRWDPVEGTGIRCELSQIRMEESGAQLEAVPVNGVKEEQADMFYTLDPQYALQGIEPSEWNGVLTISGKMQHLDPIQVFAHNQVDYLQSLQKEQAEKQQLAEELNSRQLTLTNTETELTKTKSELDEKQSELVKTQSELDLNQAELAKTQSELDLNRSELAKAQAELDWIKNTKWWKIYTKIKHTEK